MGLCLAACAFLSAWALAAALGLVGLAGSFTPAQAQVSNTTTAPPAAPPAAPAALEAAIRKALADRMPSLPKPDEIQRAPVPGLWELRLARKSSTPMTRATS
jgi:thiol:disulfide interchange protein DsbC